MLASPTAVPLAAAGSPEGSRREQSQEDPRNLLLDAFEGQVQALIDNGLEVQLRARLQRLFPAPAPSGRLPGGESEGASKDQGAVILDPMTISRIVTMLRDCRPRDSASAIANQQLRKDLVEMMKAAQP